MNIYYTTGTMAFLKTQKEKYPNENMILMENADHALLLHETEKATVFHSGRSYEVFGTVGSLNIQGFVSVLNIPITEEGKPLFEHYMKKQLPIMSTSSGIHSIRLLKPIQSEPYNILIIWDKKEDFDKWKNSQEYTEAFKQIETSVSSHTDINSMPPYFSFYYVDSEV